MAEQGSPPRGEGRALIEAVIAATVGTTIEWYDFFVYGTLAALVFPALFFPELDPFAGQLAAFSTFTVGFVARPLGGVVFGWMGDRFGRKSSLVATLLLMGISTVLMGLLPTYAEIGVTAPALLVLLRFCQGLGVGGEWGGAVLLALESGHKGQRGFYASWPQAGVPLGLLCSTAAVYFFKSAMSDEAFLAWGWRVPFLLSTALIAVGFIIRHRITETPLFAEMKQAGRVSASPVWEALRDHWPAVLLSGGARLVENAAFYLFTVYSLTHVKGLAGADVDEARRLEEAALLGINLAAVVGFFLIPAFGILSDLWSRRGLYALGCVAMMAAAWPVFLLLETRSTPLIVLALVLGVGVLHAVLYAVQASLIPELFGTRLRYTGASLGYQLAAPFAGGLAPLVAAWLGSAWLVAAYIGVLAAISLGCVLLLAETSRKDISAEE